MIHNKETRRILLGLLISVTWTYYRSHWIANAIYPTVSIVRPEIITCRFKEVKNTVSISRVVLGTSVSEQRMKKSRPIDSTNINIHPSVCWSVADSLLIRRWRYCSTGRKLVEVIIIVALTEFCSILFNWSSVSLSSLGEVGDSNEPPVE